MTTDTYSLTLDIGYEVRPPIQYGLTYYVPSQLLNGDFESGTVEHWDEYPNFPTTWGTGAATTNWDVTTDSHSGTYAGRLGFQLTGELCEYENIVYQVVTKDFNILGFWYKITAIDGLMDQEVACVLQYVDGSTQEWYWALDLYGTEQVVVGDWTYFEINLDTINLGTGYWGQVVPIMFHVYGYTETEGRLEILIDDVTTCNVSNIVQDLEYSIIVPITAPLEYRISISSPPIEVGLTYDTRVAWCNGGFETGDLTCWSTDSDIRSYDSATINVTADAKYTGTYGCRLYGEHDDDYNTLSWIKVYQSYYNNDWTQLTFRYKVNNDSYTTSAHFGVTVSYIYYDDWDEMEYEAEWLVLNLSSPPAGDWVDITIYKSDIESEFNPGVEYWGPSTKVTFKWQLGSEPS